MALSKTFDSLPSLFGTEIVFEPPPSDIPSGFDSIVQISTRLMRRTLEDNLRTWNLNPLSARVPYQSELVPLGLRALIQPLLDPSPNDPGGAPELEVQILDPLLQALNWPRPPDLGGTIGITGATTAAARAGRGFGHRMVDLVWSVQVNLFKPFLTIDPVGSAPTTGDTPAGPATTALGRTVDVSKGPPRPLPQESRTTLVKGTATMHVPSQLVVDAQLYRFRLVINFEGVQATYASDDPVMLEFLRSDLAASLLAQAIAPQWLELLDMSDEIRAFIATNDTKLKAKLKRPDHNPAR
jgi:hypothetical protein